MRLIAIPLAVGFGAGLFVAFASAAALVFALRDSGVGQEAIANTIGAGLGAALTVGGALLVESWGQAKAARGSASLIFAELEAVELALHNAELFVDWRDGVSPNPVGSWLDDARATFEILCQTHGPHIPAILAPSRRIRETLKFLSEIYATSGSPLLEEPSRTSKLVSKSVADGLECVMAVRQACLRAM